MGKLYKGSNNKRVLPHRPGEAKHENKRYPNIAAMVTGHGKTRAYLHRFKLLDIATCVCKRDQTIDHLLYQCHLLKKQKGILKKNIVNTGHWPASKRELIKKYRDSFIPFTKSIDFDLL